METAAASGIGALGRPDSHRNRRAAACGGPWRRLGGEGGRIDLVYCGSVGAGKRTGAVNLKTVCAGIGSRFSDYARKNGAGHFARCAGGNVFGPFFMVWIILRDQLEMFLDHAQRGLHVNVDGGSIIFHISNLLSFKLILYHI